MSKLGQPQIRIGVDIAKDKSETVYCVYHIGRFLASFKTQAEAQKYINSMQ